MMAGQVKLFRSGFMKFLSCNLRAASEKHLKVILLLIASYFDAYFVLEKPKERSKDHQGNKK